MAKLPAGLLIKLGDIFKWTLCQTFPVTPPLIYARCCKNILGYQSCVDQLYGGEEWPAKSCPLYRYERARGETSRINGFDELLSWLLSLYDNPSGEGSSKGTNSAGPAQSHVFQQAPVVLFPQPSLLAVLALCIMSQKLRMPIVTQSNAPSFSTTVKIFARNSTTWLFSLNASFIQCHVYTQVLLSFCFFGLFIYLSP